MASSFSTSSCVMSTLGGSNLSYCCLWTYALSTQVRVDSSSSVAFSIRTRHAGLCATSVLLSRRLGQPTHPGLAPCFTMSCFLMCTLCGLGLSQRPFLDHSASMGVVIESCARQPGYPGVTPFSKIFVFAACTLGGSASYPGHISMAPLVTARHLSVRRACRAASEFLSICALSTRVRVASSSSIAFSSRTRQSDLCTPVHLLCSSCAWQAKHPGLAPC